MIDTIEPAVNMLASADSESPIKLRSYQEEMLEASLRRNVIVAMDTGSGKTHVAIFRILAELERSDRSTLVWFMSPSVALSVQQHDVLSEHLSGYLVKTLLGKDGVDKWSDQGIWDAFLTNVRVVVGTPAVLEQALTHGFVKISRLSLLVFDEAHRCIKGGPMNGIMANFYHPTKSKGENVPHILGLTASPVMSGKLGDLATIESNLDARAVTPKHHRSELEQFVHPPQMVCITYNGANAEDLSIPQLCQALNHCVESYDLSKDPYIIQLRDLSDERSEKALNKHLDNPKTFCYRQLKALKQRCNALLEQLGPTAAEWYIRKCVKRYLESIQSDVSVLPDINEQERKHLASIFVQFPEIIPDESQHAVTTDKVRLLIHVLNQHASPSLRGIIFVEQRAAVHALAHLLRQEPEISAAFSIGTFVGVSSIYSKTPVADLLVAKDQQEDLSMFRDGRLNLMIATNVLEEGIDVTACNFVVCFDPPKNLVSFVQRRGRARQKDSKYVVFINSDELKSDPGKWQDLEAKMRQAYMDENHAHATSGLEDVEEDDGDVYRVESTGALLTLANAKAHLYHFCAVSTLYASRYIDLRPTFDTTNNGGREPYTAHVQLPPCVHPTLRTAQSVRSSRTEHAAIKDAAFQAYVALHKAGLLNDNLLPLTQDFGATNDQMHQNQPSIVDVTERASPWYLLFENTGYTDINWHAAKLELSLDQSIIAAVLIWLPRTCPVVPPFPLYWNEHLTYMVKIEPMRDIAIPISDSEIVANMRHFTRIMLRSVHSNRMSADLDDFPVLFSHQPNQHSLSNNDNIEGVASATELLHHRDSSVDVGLVRIKGQVGRSFIFSQISSGSNGDDDTTGIQLIATTFPKRRDFLHPISYQDGKGAAYTASQLFPINECTIDRLPAKYALLAAFIPSIMHRLEILLLAQNLQNNVLDTVGMVDSSLIVEAMSAPAAAEPLDYNRLEFLGDSILKFCAVLQSLSWHPSWPEGYLHMEKERLVNNNTLAKAAIKSGLDRFITTQPFTGRKWRPLYVTELLSSEKAGPREMSSKVLADVVEALIGATYVDGGLEKSFRCIRTFLPDEDWYSQLHSIERLLEDITPCQQTDLTLLQKLIGHDFAHPTLLVEAITHISFPYHYSGLSYERLEFLGDAVLDLIIVPKLFDHPRTLKHWELHNIHKAVVNGHFLGFCCMSYALEEEKFDVTPRGPLSEAEFEVQASTRKVFLHDFLRAGAPVVRAKRQSLEAFEKFEFSVREGLKSSSHYPWPDLIAMAPQKFFSDIVESILGAIYLDTSGDLSICEAFLEKLQVLDYMRHILDREVETASPKEQVGILAGQRSVEYLTKTYEETDSKKTFGCTVRVGEVDVANLGGCGSREEAEVRAASTAAEILRQTSPPGCSANQLKRKADIAVRNGSSVEA